MWLSAHNRAMQGAWSGEPAGVDSADTAQPESHQHTTIDTGKSAPDTPVAPGELLTTSVYDPYDFSSVASAHRQQEGEQPEDWLARGMALFEEGHVQAAEQAFERELLQDPENAEAWRLLAACHAENDLDSRAIDCLRRALDVDPFNLAALLSLGTSYVNELNSAQALACLKSWVRHNPKFFELDVPPDEYSDGSLMDEVTQLMMAVAEFDPLDVEVTLARCLPAHCLWYKAVTRLTVYLSVVCAGASGVRRAAQCQTGL